MTDPIRGKSDVCHTGDGAHPLASPGIEDVRTRLFAGGDRLGWAFRDRWQAARPFRVPRPVQRSRPDRPPSDAARVKARHVRRRRLMAEIGGAVLILAAIIAGVIAMLVDVVVATSFFVATTMAVTIFGAVPIVRSRRSAAAAAGSPTETSAEEEYREQLREWQRRRADHELHEANRVDELPEWGVVRRPAGVRRLDVFGGNMWAWEAFLTVHGSAALAERPVVVVDLSREHVADELARTAAEAGITVDVQVLPTQLRTTSLLSGLPPRRLIDALLESMYGEDSGATRAERSMDDRILSTLCAPLGEPLSMGRIAAGLRALLDEPDTSGYLSAAERRHIADELFSVAYRDRARERLHRLEAYVHPLEDLGADAPDAGLAALTCMVLASEGRNVRSELLTDLIVQWLTQRIVAQGASVPDVIVMGADAITVPNLERLSDACERRNIRLTLVFRHLRQTGADVIGGGAVGFMRLGNNAEATRAADFIGRGHRFVVSQITRTLGGNDSHTITDTTGRADTVGANTSVSDSESTNWNKGTSASRSDQWQPEPGTGSVGRNKGSGRSESVTWSRGGNWSVSRNWSVARSFAEGTNWSDARTEQRVYEYTVEPTQLQQLPDHVLLLVAHQAGSDTLIPVEFDPAIVTLPRVSPVPFDELPTVRPDGPGDLGAGPERPAIAQQPRSDETR